MEFAQPASGASGDRFVPADHLGKLVAFYGLGKDTVQTEFGEATVATVEVAVVLDADGGPEPYSDILVFGAALAPALYKKAPGPVLGVIGKGEAKPGRSAPWILLAADETQQKAANEWHKKGNVTQKDGAWVWAADEAPF